MQFGNLATKEAIDKRFKQLRTQSRQEILSQIYGTNNSKYNEPTVQKDISDAFMAILQHYDYQKNTGIVKEISQMFGLSLESMKGMTQAEREKILFQKIYDKIEEGIKIIDKMTNDEETLRNNKQQQTQHNNHFEWLGIRTKYSQLRPIFQEILLQKVKLFDNELTQLTDYTNELQSTVNQNYFKTIEAPTTARQRLASTQSVRSAAVLSSTTMMMRNKTLQDSMRHRRVQSGIQSQFCNVKIRDKSQFQLKKWTQREQDQFQQKKAVFRNNLKINNVPVLFQFVKKYTQTVKARDNIYRKWEERQKFGISPEQLRYLCATSLFLNNSLAKSQKKRIQKNLYAAGPQMISKLQLNISQKIIQTYHILMKKVSDLRAKYYEELTQMRKKQQKQGSSVAASKQKKNKKTEMFQKYKNMFAKIVNSQKMKLQLNTRIYKWVNLFIANLKKSIDKPIKKGGSEAVFKRLAKPITDNSLFYQLKMKFPSSRIIKREDQYSHRLKYQTYIPSQRFMYERKFQNSIKSSNKIKLNSTHQAKFYQQLTGGPRENQNTIRVDLNRKQVYLSSPKCVKFIIAIQAKWKAVYQRKRFIAMLEEEKQKKKRQFQDKILSLKRIYPEGRKLNVKAIEGRLKRVNMQISNILKPYVRVSKKQINTYISFCVNKMTGTELKSKHARNGVIRLGQFNRLVQTNQYHLLKKSGIVVTSKQINNNVLEKGANAVWWSVYHSNIELTRLFLQGGGDPNSKDNEDNTCLHVAIKNGDIQIIFLLLDFGADLNKKNNKKVTPLYYATSKMLKLLGLQQGAVIGDKDNNSIFYRKTIHQQDVYQQHYF